MKDGRKELSESEKEGPREGGREMGRHGLIQAIGSCLKVHTCVLTNTKDGLVSPEMCVAEWITHYAVQFASCLVEEATEA